MKVLVIGSGAREHAICWKISQSPKVKKIYCVPGNAGISKTAELVSIKQDDFKALAEFVRTNSVDLTFVGPEAPLADGIVDYFEKQGLKIFGPNKKAAQLEASKAFSKDIMKKYNVPTAKYEVFEDFQKALEYLKKHYSDKKVVLKADGLAQGKGVLICNNGAEAKNALTEIMEKKAFGSAGAKVIIEEFLEGEEVSVMIFVDGKNYSVMVSSQDHKRVFDNDQGLNTGGMGAYAPAPVFNDSIRKKTEEKIIKPMINGLLKEGIKYKGILYAGLMVVNNEPFVIEFNCRFGDPETEVILPLLKTDLVEIVESIIEERLDKIKIEWYNKSAVAVVLASGGYPGSYEKDKKITGLNSSEETESITVFHAGTALKNGEIVTNGGRVLAVTGTADNIKDAIQTAYKGVEKIKFEKMHYRKDIAYRALNRG